MNSIGVEAALIHVSHPRNARLERHQCRVGKIQSRRQLIDVNSFQSIHHLLHFRVDENEVLNVLEEGKVRIRIVLIREFFKFHIKGGQFHSSSPLVR